MIRTSGRFGMIVVTLLVFLLGSVGVVSAHDAAATLTCAEQGVTLHIAGGGYPDGSTITYSVNGGASTVVSANGTYDVDAGSPTVAHTADVLFFSNDGGTQFNYHFALTSEACVATPPSSAPSAPPSAAPSGAPLPSGKGGPISGSPSPSGGVEGVTGTPAPTPPPTDSITGAPSSSGWALLLGGIALATIAIFLATGLRTSKRSR